MPLPSDPPRSAIPAGRRAPGTGCAAGRWDFAPSLDAVLGELDSAARQLRRHLARHARAAVLPGDDAALAAWLESVLRRAAARPAHYASPFDALEALWETQRHDSRAQRDGHALVAALVATLGDVLGSRLDRELRMGWTCACNLLVAESLAWASHARAVAGTGAPAVRRH